MPISAAGQPEAQRRDTLQTPASPVPSGLPELTVDHVVLRYWPGREALARALLATGAIAPLPGLPPDALAQGGPAVVYLAPDEARFDSLTGGHAPDWGAGIAIPREGVIVLPGYASHRGNPTALGRVLRHELAHVALQRYVGDVQVPRWFSEGYATWAAGQLDFDGAWLLRIAFLTGSAPPLDSLALAWPAAETPARVAYLLSASAVQYLYREGGERGLQVFFQHWRQGGDFEQALRTTYGLTLTQLEKYWSRDVRRRYGWVLFLAQSVVLWLIVGVGVIALYVVRHRRDRRRLEHLRATEIPDDPAYWMSGVEVPGEGRVREGGADGTPPPGPEAARAPDRGAGNDVPPSA